MAEYTETTLENFEKDYKKSIFDRVEHLCFSQRKLISGIKTAERFLDLDGTDEFPNIGITFNNKLVELIHMFQDAGISMFSQKFENYGPKKLNFVSSSFVGDALISYMLDTVSKGVDVLSKYHSKLNALIDAEEEKYMKLENATPLKKLFLTIRSFVSFPEELYFSYTDDDIDELNSHISEYIEIDNQLWASTLKDIIVPSLVTHIKEHRYSKETISSLLDECIIPDLSKLELDDLIPELRQEIAKLFEQPEEQHSIKKVSEPSVDSER